MFEAESALSSLDKIIISNRTRDFLEHYSPNDLETSRCGIAYDAGDRLGFVEYDESYRTRQLDFARRLGKIVSEHCRVEPGYGDFENDEKPAKVSEVLGGEASEAVLLAREHGAVLLTLDGRLRLLAKRFYGIEGVWPHAVVTVATESGFVTSREASVFSAGSFLYRRTFVPLNAENIIWMFSHGDWSMQRGMGLLKTYLSAPETEFASVDRVVRAFLRILTLSRPQLGAYAEIMGHLLEAVLRRSDCPPKWLESMATYLDNLFSNGIVIYALEILNRVPREELNAELRFLYARMSEVRDRAKNPERNDTVRAKVLFCCRRPTFVVDNKISISEMVVGGGDEEEEEKQARDALTTGRLRS
jgi:hypothetical protein